MAIDLMCNSRGQERMWVLLSWIEISPDLGLKSTLRLYYKSVAAQTKCDGFGLARCNFCLIPTHNKIWRLVTQITRLSFKAYLIKNSHFPQQVMTSSMLYDVTISLTEEFVKRACLLTSHRHVVVSGFALWFVILLLLIEISVKPIRLPYRNSRTAAVGGHKA